jgi:phenazine biosynthesis protein phzE
MNVASTLKQILKSNSNPFALLYRPEVHGKDVIELLTGKTKKFAKLADIPLEVQVGNSQQMNSKVLILIPHQQIIERNYSAKMDDSHLLAFFVEDHGEIALSDALEVLPNEPIDITNSKFDINDKSYESVVREVLSDEIGQGQGSNFVIKRSFIATINNFSVRKALSLFRRLVFHETRAYWTFIIHTGDRIFIGATPERHISLQHGVAMMNPISGTYRYPERGPVLSDILDFLSDQKETKELYMVLDEELKMMAQICKDGGQVIGPFLKEMAKLAHTEYYIKGNSDLDPRDILRETMFAPTVTGSPLQNACRVISRYESAGRGFYGGVAALVGSDHDGSHTIDSAILIRTADINLSSSNKYGSLSIGVGATLVQQSDPISEVEETHAKVAGILAALNSPKKTTTTDNTSNIEALSASNNPQVIDMLNKRNSSIAKFWLSNTSSRSKPSPQLIGRRTLIVDAEDHFTGMLAIQLREIGLDVEVINFNIPYKATDYDLVVLGPGPGDPRDLNNPRIANMSALIAELISQNIPFFAVCLSHQLLCQYLGIELFKREIPNQGVQKNIELFGSPIKAGFYNSFYAHCNSDELLTQKVGRALICRDYKSGEVHALKGQNFSSVQFHIESVLTQDGPRVLTELLNPLLANQKELTA